MEKDECEQFVGTVAPTYLCFVEQPQPALVSVAAAYPLWKRIGITLLKVVGRAHNFNKVVLFLLHKGHTATAETGPAGAALQSTHR